MDGLFVPLPFSQSSCWIFSCRTAYRVPAYFPVPAGVNSASLGSLAVVSLPGSSAISPLSPSSLSAIPDCSSYSFFSSRWLFRQSSLENPLPSSDPSAFCPFAFWALLYLFDHEKQKEVLESGWKDVLRYSVVSDSLWRHGLYVACQTPLSMGFFWQEYWSGVPFRLPRDLPDWGIKLDSLVSPALAGRFFTTSATWEAQMKDGGKIFCHSIAAFQGWRSTSVWVFGWWILRFCGSAGKSWNRGQYLLNCVHLATSLKWGWDLPWDDNWGGIASPPAL